jgi:hypothetical protein
MKKPSTRSGLKASLLSTPLLDGRAQRASPVTALSSLERQGENEKAQHAQRKRFMILDFRFRERIANY